MSTIAAARQAVVSFSDVRRSTSLRNMILKADRLEKRDKLRLLLFHYSFRSGYFEEPGATVAARPTHEHARRFTSQIDGGKFDLTGLYGNDHRIERARLRGGQADLLTPSIDVISVASALAGKRHHRNVGLLAISFDTETREAHRRRCRWRPSRRNFPFYLRLLGIRRRRGWSCGARSRIRAAR